MKIHKTTEKILSRRGFLGSSLAAVSVLRMDLRGLLRQAAATRAFLEKHHLSTPEQTREAAITFCLDNNAVLFMTCRIPPAAAHNSIR
jgi:hypothetical protein